MAFTLPELPYAMDALVPVFTKETFEFHYGKHHRTYVDKLNKIIKDTELEKKSLEELIVQTRTGDVFNNAAQIWNHTFFWNSMTPRGGGKPTGKIAAEIDKNFGSFDAFKGKFQDAALSLFGSGWVWLSRVGNGSLVIEKAKDADNPLVYGNVPLLTVDVWEHAYYIDYRNDRARFVNTFWDVVNWSFANQNLDKILSK